MSKPWDVHHCAKGNWQQLALIKFKPADGTIRALPDPHMYKESNSLQLAATLTSTHTRHTRTTAVPNTAMAQLVGSMEPKKQEHIAAAFSHLQGPSQRQLTHLSVTFYNKQGADMIAQIVQLDLPHLADLDLNSSSLTAAALQQLAKGQWPLRRLRLSNNLIDEAAMAALSQGN